MTVIGVGDMQMMDGAKFPGVVIQASREELQAVAGNILYKEVAVLPLKSENARLRAALKPVLECTVISNLFAIRGACMNQLSDIVSEAQRIYDDCEKAR